MNRREARQRNRNFNLRRKLRARLLRSPAYSHQLLDLWGAAMRRRGL